MVDVGIQSLTDASLMDLIIASRSDFVVVNCQDVRACVAARLKK